MSKLCEEAGNFGHNVREYENGAQVHASLWNKVTNIKIIRLFLVGLRSKNIGS
jgi:hypothetical protein